MVNGGLARQLEISFRRAGRGVEILPKGLVQDRAGCRAWAFAHSSPVIASHPARPGQERARPYWQIAREVLSGRAIIPRAVGKRGPLCCRDKYGLLTG